MIFFLDLSIVYAFKWFIMYVIQENIVPKNKIGTRFYLKFAHMLEAFLDLEMWVEIITWENLT